MLDTDHRITSIEQLEALYGQPAGAAVLKEIDHINAEYRAFIEAAPFFALATVGPEGVDCSPRGDEPGFVRVADEKTLMIPDRRGNNRIDSLAQHRARPARVAAVPHSRRRRDVPRDRPRRDLDRSGAVRELRVRRQDAARGPHRVGRERLLPVLQGDHPLEAVGRRRASSTATSLPSNGTILAAITKGEHGGEEYDKAYPERLKADDLLRCAAAEALVRRQDAPRDARRSGLLPEDTAKLHAIVASTRLGKTCVRSREQQSFNRSPLDDETLLSGQFWGELRVFLAVAKTKSFNRAAEILNTSQPTVSRQVKRLQDIVGSQLFISTPRGVKLTQKGEALAKALARLDHTLHSITSDLKAETSEAEGIVRVSITDGLNAVFAAPCACALLRQYPRIQLHLKNPLNLVSLRENQTDMMIGLVPNLSSDIQFRKLGQFHFIPVVC